MKKHLPNVFPVPMNKKINNSQDLFYSSNSFDRSEKKLAKPIDIKSKINNIFSAHDYIYQKSVRLRTKNGIHDKVIIGKTDDSLLTKDDERIKFDDILDIN